MSWHSGRDSGRPAWAGTGAAVLAGAAAVLPALGWQLRARRRWQRQAAQLAANIARREQGLASSPVPIVIVTREGLVLRENAAGAALLGEPVDGTEWVGRPLSVVDASGRAVALGTGDNLRGATLTLQTSTGPRQVTVYSTEAPHGDGRLLVISDQTKQQQLQADLAQAQKLEALGRLAGQVAHDFNNLLMPIAGYLDLVLSGGGPLCDEDRESLTECHRATNRAAALVEKILAISRQQGAAHASGVDAVGAVRDMAGLMAGIVGPDISLEVRLPAAPDLAAAKTDRTAFEQVLVNLVTNARDATPPGGRIDVELAEEGQWVTLRVADTGSGMDEQTRRSLFDPFYTTKRERGGTGLGLATVRGLVEGAGGTVEVVSEPGRGATFTVRLPRGDTLPGPEPDRRMARPGSTGGQRLVMVVDDEPQVRALIRLVLERRDYRVLAFACAEDAQRDCASRLDDVDLLLTDVVLPGASGPELARWATAIAPRLPVIFMSGYAEGELTEHGRVPAGTVLLRKPFQADELIQHLADALGPVPG